MCVRPEDLDVHDGRRNRRNAVRAHVDHLEFLGASFRATMVVAEMDERRVTADISPNLVRELAIDEGSELTVVFPDDRLHVFTSH